MRHKTFLLTIVCSVLQLQQAEVRLQRTKTLLTSSHDNAIFFNDSNCVNELSGRAQRIVIYMMLISGGMQVMSGSTKYYVHHMVSIRSRFCLRYFGDNHFCSGTIITANIVLTSTHCVMDKRGVITRPRRMVVIAGTPRRTQCGNTTLRYDVDALFPQPTKQRDKSNRLALVRIKGAFPHGNLNVRVIYLPTIPPPYNKTCTMVGWGRMFYRGPLSDAAVHVDVTLLPPQQCEQLRSDVSTVGMLCAANALDDYESDTCPGDTGGPLICEGQLTGIIAWNLLCGNISLPSLFIAVQPQVDWILAVMSSCYGCLPGTFTFVASFLLSSIVVNQFVFSGN